MSTRYWRVLSRGTLALASATCLVPSQADASPRVDGDAATHRSAALEEPAASSRPAAGARRRARGSASSYAGALTWGYALAPLLAIPMGAALFEVTRSDTASIAGGALAVVSVPVTIHALEGEAGRSIATGLLLPAATAVGLLAGGAMGYWLGPQGCDDSDCEVASTVLFTSIGAGLGGLGGYVGYAVYDVGLNSDRAGPRAQLPSSVRLWATPLGASSEQTGLPSLRGVLLGAAWVH